MDVAALSQRLGLSMLDHNNLKPKFDASKCGWKHCRTVGPLAMYSRFADGKELYLCEKHWNATQNGAPTPTPTSLATLNPPLTEVPQSTAPVALVPTVTGPVVSLETEIAQRATDARTALAQWQQMVIQSEVEYTVASEILVAVKAESKILEEKKQSVLKPLNEGLRNLRALFAQAQDPYTQLEFHIKNAITRYHEEIERKRQEALRAIDDAATSTEVGAALQELSTTTEPEKQKGVSLREVTKYQIVDESLIPRQFLCPDETKIRHAVAAGIEIPGVKVFTEKSVAVRAG